VGWLLRYLSVDALCDVLFFVLRLKKTNRGRATERGGVESAALALYVVVIAGWIGLVFQLYDLYELHVTTLSRFYAAHWISGAMILVAPNIVERG
jgi:hypothetical protein